MFKNPNGNILGTWEQGCSQGLKERLIPDLKKTSPNFFSFSSAEQFLSRIENADAPVRLFSVFFPSLCHFLLTHIRNRCRKLPCDSWQTFSSRFAHTEATLVHVGGVAELVVFDCQGADP